MRFEALTLKLDRNEILRVTLPLHSTDHNSILNEIRNREVGKTHPFSFIPFPKQNDVPMAINFILFQFTVLLLFELNSTEGHLEPPLMFFQWKKMYLLYFMDFPLFFQVFFFFLFARNYFL